MESPAYATLMKPAKSLRPRQVAMLAFIREYIGTNGYAPNLREIQEHSGFRDVSTVHYNLQRLQAAGKLKMPHFGVARGIVLTDGGPCPHCGKA